MADSRIQKAFHEVKHNVPKIVKHTARTEGAEQARKQSIAIALSKARKAGADVPGASGANYVSRDELFVPAGSKAAGWTRGGSTVPYKVCPQLEAGEATGEHGTSAELGTGRGLSTEGASSSATTIVFNAGRQVGANEGPVHGNSIATIKMVDRRLNPVEQARMANNLARDMRTNLGRGKFGNVNTVEANNVAVTR